MIKQGELQRIAGRHKVRDRQIEKDYIIAWVLFGISQNRLLKETLAFKGGTVLKKAYFPDYRFSEDLDFTLLKKAISNKTLLAEFENSFRFVQEDANIVMQVREHHLHPQTQSLSFYTDYVGPQEGILGSRDLKIDITRNETLEFDLEQRNIHVEYSDLNSIDFSLNCYSLSEVLIEKMAALMGRTIPRDLYDFWYLLEIEQLALNDHIYEFERKAMNKGLNPNEFMNKVLSKEKTLKRDWQKSLENQVYDLPDFKDIFREIKRHLRKM